MKNHIIYTLICLTALAGLSVAAPKPAVVQGPDDWTLEAEFQHLQQISVKLGDNNKPRRYWYLILTIANNTGRDVGFYPDSCLMTDTFQITPAGQNVPSAVFQRIKQRYKTRYPFLESIEQTDDKVLQGEDNSKDVAIIFPDFDPEAKGVKIFIAGLSNETVMVEHPTARDEGGQPVQIFLRKTLQLNYNLGGDPAFRSNIRLTYEGQEWIMR